MDFMTSHNDYIPLHLPEELAVPSSDADNAGLLLISCACNLYKDKFHSNSIPFSFIEFFINELSHYKDKLDSPIVEFFNYYQQNKNLELYVRMYTMSGYNTAKGIKTIDGYQYLILDPKNNFYIDDYIERPLSTISGETAKQLKDLYNEYGKGDELKSLNDLFDDFLIEKFIENYNNVEHQEKTKKQQKTTQDVENERLNTTLIGVKNEMPNQKGKVVQLNIPKFKLPMTYPIDLSNSRILSEKRAKKFASADKCIKFINKHAFTAIGFSVGFVEKRKSVKKKKNFDKFGFDF